MRNPDFNRASNLVARLFIDNAPCSLPINLENIYSKYTDILRVRSYTWFAKRNRLSIEDVIKFVDSEEGCCYYITNKHRYLILFNDTIPNIGNQRWTIAHELGHFFLKHNEETKEAIITRNSISDTSYEVLEKEANCFARELLAHPSILHSLNILSTQEIMEFCQISFTAAGYVSTFIAKGIEMGRRFRLKSIAKPFFDFIHKKKCSRCNYLFVSEVAKYCPVCGDNQLVSYAKLQIWGDVTIMYYLNTEVNEHGKVGICLRCKNEGVFQDRPDFPYCKICGAILVNKCAGELDTDYNGNEYYTKEPCGTIAEGNARFCVKCGSPTTFNMHKLLKPWEEELKGFDDDTPF